LRDEATDSERALIIGTTLGITEMRPSVNIPYHLSDRVQKWISAVDAQTPPLIDSVSNLYNHL